MALPSYIKTTSARLNSVPIVEGQIILCTDIQILYFDTDSTTRLALNGKVADKLGIGRVITLSGDVSGSVTFDGTTNVDITTTIKDDSHNHVIGNVDGLQGALDAKLATSLKGAANGLAELDSSGKVPASQLPSYVDDVVEGYLSDGKFYKESAHTNVISGESSKLYMDLASSKVYRWSGSAYVVISETLALGETASTAYRGDRGKIAYDHSQATHARTDATNVADSTTNGNIKINGTETNVYTHPAHTAKASGLYKVTVDDKGHVSATAAVAKADITGLGIPAQDTVYTHPSHTAAASGLYKVTVDNKGHVSATDEVVKADITALGIPAQDTVYTHPSYTAKESGLYKVTVDNKGHVSATAAVAKADITGLGIPAQDTTYPTMTGATTTATGAGGLVPAPPKGAATRYLRSDGSWVVPPNTTYSNASGTAAGLMSASDKSKLDGISANANNYTHPSHTAATSGLYKVTVDDEGHVTATDEVVKADITGLGIPAQDTVYTHPAHTAHASGLYKVTVDNKGHVTAASEVVKADITALGIPSTNTTYGVMTAATASAAGGAGLVPAPAKGKQASYLRGDGTWAVPTNTTYSAATASALGLVKSAGDITVANDGTVTVKDDSHNHVIGNVDGLQGALDAKLATSLKGAVNGLAELDSSGKVPSAQLPSYVDDVIEAYLSGGKFYAEAEHTTEITGEVGKIYIDLHTNKTYRWSGSVFAVISETLALGETASTAYRGDRGKVAYNHSQATHARTDATNVADSATNGNIKINGTETNVYTHPAHTAKASGLYKITVNSLGHVTAADTVDKADITALGIPAQDTVYTHPGYTAKTSGLYKITVDATGHVSATTAVAKADITALGIPSTNTTYNNMGAATASAAGTAGLVPAPAAGKQASYLRGDGTWAVPTNTTYNDMKGATTSAAGTHGLVPAPAKGAATRYLRSDGTWQVPPNTTYGAATTSSAGLMSASDKSKLDGISASANNYTHPAHTAYASGLYKVTVDAKGHVTAATAVAKADITALGIPSTNTTYSNMGAATASAAGTAGLVPAPAAGKQASFLRGDGTWVVPTNTTYNDATTSTHGLMSTADKTKLDGIATGANKYVHPSHTAKSSGLYKVTVDSTGHVSAATAVAKADITALGIPAQDTVYTHPTSAGNKHIPAGGSSGQILRWSAAGTAVWGSDNNTDTKVTNTLATTTKSYITGTATATTNTGTQNFDTGVYLTNVAGEMNAGQYKISEKAIMKYDATNECVSFVFV